MPSSFTKIRKVMPIGYGKGGKIPKVLSLCTGRGKRGGLFWKGMWNKVIKPAGNFIKDNHLISEGIKLIPGGQPWGDLARKVGLGRRGGRRLPINGMGAGDTLSRKVSIASDLADGRGYGRFRKIRGTGKLPMNGGGRQSFQSSQLQSFMNRINSNRLYKTG